MTFLDVLDSLRRHWVVPLVMGIVALISLLLVVFQTTSTETDLYEARALIALPEEATQVDDASVVARFPDVEVKRLTSFEFLEKALANAQMSVDLSDLDVEAYSPTSDPPLVEFAVTAISPDDAKRVRDALADYYVDTLTRINGNLHDLRLEKINGKLKFYENQFQSIEQAFHDLGIRQGDDPRLNPRYTLLNGQIEAVAAEISDLKTRQLQLQATTQENLGSPVEVVERSDPLGLQANVFPFLVPIIILFIVTAGVSVGGAVLLDKFDATIRSPGEAVKLFQTELLGVVPRHKVGELDPAIVHAPATERARSYQSLASTLMVSGTDGTASFLVTSPKVSRETTIVAANVAAGIAELGYQALFVLTRAADVSILADMGLRGKDMRGFNDVLAMAATGVDDIALEESLKTKARQVPSCRNLWVVAPGKTQEAAAAPWVVDRMLSVWRAHYDVIVLTGPAVLGDPFASTLIGQVESVLWVAEIDKTVVSSAQTAVQRMMVSGGKSSGVTVVGAKGES